MVSANLAVSLGMSFEYTTQKQYNFSVRVKSKTSTNETIDIITPNYNFDFYVVGTIGIRAGIRLEMYVGLFSLKLDKIGITAEAGAYARLWGYFFYHLHWKQGAGKTENSAGAMFIEIGMYLDINFVAQLLSSSKLTWNPTIYSNEWPLWSAGEQQNVYAFADADDDSYTLTAVTELTLPTSTFDMSYMDLKSGETGTVNKDDTTESNFVISFSNSDDFSYDPATNTVTVKPSASAMGEETDMTITWKKAALSFSSTPIQKTIHIEWSDPENVRYLSFNSVGGSMVDPITGSAGQSITLTDDQNPTKQGYTFAGWYKDALYNSGKQTTVTLPTSDKGITLYAKWTPNTNTPYTVEHYTEELNGSYTLTTKTLYGTTAAETTITADVPAGFTAQSIKQQIINADGSTVVKVYYDRDTYTVTFKDGVSEANNVVKTYKYGAELAAPAFAREGYVFKAWNTTLPTYVTEDVTYTATWEGKDNTVIFDSQGGSAVDSATVKTGEKITEPNAPTKTGYTFKGWYTDQLCTKEWDFTNNTVSGPMALYAKWEGAKYTVSFNANYDGGTVAPVSKEVTFGAAYGTLPTLPRTGYGFDGWFTAETGGTKVDATTTVTTAADGQTLYAHWTANTNTAYTVEHYQQNIENDEYTLTDTDNLAGTTGEQTAAVAKTYEGFTAKSSTQETIAADGSTVVKVYYDRNIYTITWQNYDGSTLETDTNVKFGAMPSYDSATPTRTLTGHSCTFAGWLPTVSAVTDNVTYTATFTDTANRYSITYNLNGGTNNTKNPATYIYGEGVSLAAPTKTGYTFDGWFTDSSFTEDTKVTTISTTQIGEVTLYAKWTVNKHTLTWNENGGNELVGSYTSGEVVYGATITSPTNPTRAGYTFMGWEPTVPSTMPDSDLTFTARWEINHYTVTFNAKGGSMVNSQTVDHGSAATSASSTRTGYSLEGWYTDEGCTAQYDFTTPVTANLTLYAKWTANTYKVTFHAGDGGTLPDDATNPMTVTYGEAYGTLPTPTHSDVSAKFNGWYTEEVNGTQVTEDTIVSINENVTLYAQWDISYTAYSHIKINNKAIEVAYNGFVKGYGDTLKYDSATNTLTMNNATIESCEAYVTLKLERCTINDTTVYPVIKVKGNNTVKNTRNDLADGFTVCGIRIDSFSDETATFIGNGTLTIETADKLRAENIPLYAKSDNSMIIDGPTIIVKAGNNYGGDSYGVRIGSNDKQLLKIWSGSLTVQGQDYAVNANGIVDKDGNTLSVTASTSYDGSGATTVEANQANLERYKYLTTGTIGSTN